MSAVSRRPGQTGSDYGLLIAVLAGAVLTGSLTLAVHLGNQLDGGRQNLPGHPIALLGALFKGQLTWPAPATWLLAGAGVLLLALTGIVLWRARRRRKRSTRVDRANTKMARVQDLAGLTPAGAGATAARLGVATPGLPIARTINGTQLYSGWEDVCVDIWGPRTGKTTSRGVPAILAAPGAVLTTSNKRDACDATRDPRAQVGRVWVFDPQQLAGEEPSWWWNPLTYVTDEVKARALAKVLTDARKKPGTTGDDYFAPAAVDLLGDLLLAAAVGHRPITQVYLWLTDSSEDEQVALLATAGHDLPAANVRSVLKLPYKQRDGIYDGAKQTMSFLVNRNAQRWVTPPAAHHVEHFDVAGFIGSTDTLYLLSKEGEGTTAPLVLALTVAVLEAGEARAARSPGGRLVTPLTVVLDEAANVVRWQSLPDLYSHFGSRGIVVLCILQSWSQGVAVWGPEGMRKLWSAANVRVYGGGVSETGFLSELSQLVGRYDLTQVSRTVGKGTRSTTRSITREAILEVDDLADLPKGRAVVFSSGHRAALVRTVPWMAGPHAAAIAASITAHDPAAAHTLDTAYQELAQVQDRERDIPTPQQLRADNPWIRA